MNYLFYKLDNCILQQVTDNPYLGLQISQDLKWHSHICNVTKKASSILGFLQRNLKHCSKECRRTAYLSLIRSTLEYGAIIWDPYHKSDINRIERIQNRAARFINQDFSTREPGCVTNMLKDLKLPSLEERRRQLRLLFMYKVVEGLVPAMPADQFFEPQSKAKRQIKAKIFSDCVSTNVVKKSACNNTRPFKIPNSTTDQYRFSFFVKTVQEWNNLDDQIVKSKTVDSFKSNIQAHKCD